VFTGQTLQLGLDITPIWNFTLLRLAERLPVPNPGQCVAELQRWLMACLKAGPSDDEGISELIVAVQQSNVPLKTLAGSIGITQRTLQRRLKHKTGYSLRELTLFGRMQRVRRLLCSSRINLAEVALQCGYFDQAHFSHSFKNYALETPAVYRKRKLSQIYKPLRHFR